MIWVQQWVLFVWFISHTYTMGEFDIPTSTLTIEPSQASPSQLIAKTIMGWLMGVLIAFVIFAVVTVLGSTMFDTTSVNPLLPIILMLIAFVCTFIGNSGIALIYNLVYGQKYYDMTKMFSLILLSNFLLFLILAPIYFVFTAQLNTLFLVLAFHVLFSVFLSFAMIEFLPNPNYAWSSLVGVMLGFVVCIFVYLLVFKSQSASNIQSKLYYLMLLPSLLWYTLIPLIHGIREKVYYKFYEMGNDFFYIPSLNEVMVDQEEAAHQSSSDDDPETQVNVQI